MSCIHWFRKGLRLTDNPALLASLEVQKGSRLELRPVFVLDPWFVKNGQVGENRWRFLAQSLKDLDCQLKSLGVRLFVVRGLPNEVLPKLFKSWNVKKLTFESDTEPYSVKRDEEITDLAGKFNVEVVTKLSHTLYNPHDVVKKYNGQTPKTYQAFQSTVASMPKPKKPLPKLTSIPKECKISNQTELNDRQYDVPTLKELCLVESELQPCKFPGGETEGLLRLEKYICEKNGKWVRKFEKPQTSPNSLEPSTTVLSPYLKFGCVSCRDMYYRIINVYAKGQHSKPPVSIAGQLLWREFFYTCGATIPNFNQVKGNSICKKIPWREDDKKDKYLQAWKNGATGFPFIDAIMTQLRQEGWIHHLARHSVACFLTRGDLWVSWEEGQAVFEELLLDADWSLNAANWQWLSASAFFHQYYRVYSPVAFGKKTDPLGSYIRKYVPKLTKFSKEYIYEPWKAPISVQKDCGCIIGEDYPKPIVDHDTVHKENIIKMKAAYVRGNVEQTSNSCSSFNRTEKKRRNEFQKNKITKCMKKS